MSKNTKRIFAGINIQYPISSLIIDGTKSVETRHYPIPPDYVGKKLVLIETPGKSGLFGARIVAFITFGESFMYKTEKSFYEDKKKHLVTQDSPWAWKQGKNKWGWPILNVKSFEYPLVAPIKKGIKFTRSIDLSKLSRSS